jgi:hypothetical protein
LEKIIKSHFIEDEDGLNSMTLGVVVRDKTA